jgi:hypothetical protein
VVNLKEGEEDEIKVGRDETWGVEFCRVLFRLLEELVCVETVGAPRRQIEEEGAVRER